MTTDTELSDDTKVTVCDACLCACCWRGKFPCDRTRGAGITTRTVRELRALDREHPSYWEPQP